MYTALSTSPAQRLALAFCLIASVLWAAGTIGFEITFFTRGDLAVLSQATLISFIALAALAAGAWHFAWRGSHALPETVDPANPWHLAVLMFLGMILPTILFRPDADDSYYLPNVIFALTHPGQPITDEIRGLAAVPLEPFRSAHWATSTAYDYLTASVAYWTGLPALDIRYFWLPGLGGFVLVTGCFLLLRELTEKESDALIATFALLALYLIWVEQHRDPGNFAFLRMFQAKAVLMTAVLPAFTALLYCFLRAPSVLTGLAIALLGTGSAGMTASAVFLIGAVAVGVTVGAIAAKPCQAMPILFRTAIAGVLCVALLLPLMRVLAETLPLGNDSPANDGWPQTFFGHVAFLGKSTWLLFLLSCGITLFGTTGAARRFVLGWTATVVILFANPVSGQFLIDHVLGANAYWRIFYALPWAALAGLSIIALYHWLPSRFSRTIIPAITAIIFLALATHFTGVNRRFGPGALLPPSWKLHPELVTAARAVTDLAPDGPMLAPFPLSSVIPLVSGTHPQLRLRTSGLKVWTLAAGRQDMADRRILATSILSETKNVSADLPLNAQDPPLPRKLEALSQVVAESQPASVVFHTRALGRSEIAFLLGQLGYSQATEADYFEVWVPIR